MRNGKVKRYCSFKCKNNAAVTRRRRKLKAMAVEHLGGKCMSCGYDKSVWAMDFHHLDPSQKDFAISVAGNSMSWENVRKEVEKCILLCKNCHAELHAFEFENMGTKPNVIGET
jgi:hypothetical protein